ncbi:CheR family methyltransferase [Bacillus horti]|uniref:histidine kinase n=1 Tax=Caldalkalibacillus horti TaxID=77523 RepID=A0ABT9W5X0_9BACI|nr:CheR family methyltransferase [Bacillus horti]MDQ0168240.1 two-component system CheB/CheR fusion protein [Bacillus horti]
MSSDRLSGKDAKSSLDQNQQKSFIVGIGASAGGLEAITSFFDHLGATHGIAFVVIQHLSPRHKSYMVELLSKHTSMPVYHAQEGMMIELGCIYLLPPNKCMTIHKGKLVLSDRALDEPHFPIDVFLTSLAHDQKEQAMAIILSGKGNDGAIGVQAIHEQGGLVFVQDEDTAQYSDMPQSAMATNVVNYMMTVEEMAIALESIVGKQSLDITQHRHGETYADILYEIKQYTGMDFSYYRPNSILRRIEKRMSLLEVNCTTIQQYWKYLQNHEEEIERLQQDILIGVTSFFRDPNAFRVLESHILPKILKHDSSDREVRMWVAGCSTGEEAYSLAILCKEYMRKQNNRIKIKIFATDIDKRAIEHAGHGTYSAEIERTLTPELLGRYFTQLTHMNGYQVNREIRAMIVFATHDVTKDAPFINMDLISCRNLLIYFKPELQEKVLSIFHYALTTKGHLFLGSSETIGKLSYYFEPVDVKWSIFSYKESTRASVPISLGVKGKVIDQRMDKKKYQSQLLNKKLKQTKNLQTIILDKFMTPSIIVDELNEVVQFCGHVNQFLLIPTGQASLHLSKIIHIHTYVAIHTAIKKVRRERKEVVFPTLFYKGDGSSMKVMLTVKPLSRYTPFSSYVIIFMHKLEEENQEETSQYINIEDSINQHIIELEQELEMTKEILQSTIEELETANEEMQSTNEELIAANEEMQSINEELQSVNEELLSVNTEHEMKIEELTDLNNDMDNFLVSTQIATIFLDRKLYVKRFTPSVKNVVHLLEVDIGRPIAHINHNLIYADLLTDARSVLHTSRSIEKEIRSYDGRWFSMRILPYRTKEKDIDGIVITFMDITDIKLANRKLQRLHTAIEQSPNIVVICDMNNNIEYANLKFYENTGWTTEEIHTQKQVPFLYFEELTTDEYQQYLDRFKSNKPWIGEMKYLDKAGHLHWASVTVLPFKDEFEGTMQNLILAEDISEKKHAEQILKRSEMMSALGELAAGIAHEIRNPLTALKGFTRLMQSENNGNANYLSIMMDEFVRIETIITELLGLSKPSMLSYEKKDIVEILEDVKMLLETQAIIKNIQIVTEFKRGIGLIKCVPNQLKQVFINILKNAIESMDNGGEVVIKAKKKNRDWIQVQIKDQGPGIPEEVLSRIGQPFFTTKEKGTGLGMMVSFKIIEDHNGRMLVDSEEGKGTVIDIMLPVIKF